MGLSRTSDREFDLAEQLVRVINERDLHFTGLADARIGEVLFASLALGLVRQLLANLREMVLTVGILPVGQEFGPFAPSVTAPAQEIPGGPHCGRIDRGLR